jgi:AAA15 family ATPase/GTPase
MITRFHVESYKALRDVTLELTPIHVLIGPNDSGKTSIFEALTALSRTTEPQYDMDTAFGARWQARELVSPGVFFNF